MNFAFKNVALLMILPLFANHKSNSTIRKSKSLLTTVLIASLSITLLSCAAKKPQNASRLNAAPTMISIKKANKIIADYLSNEELAWGVANMIRSAPNRYIYNFDTPKAEIKSKGPRRLVIDVTTGKVSFPTQSGGLFGKPALIEGKKGNKI